MFINEVSAAISISLGLWGLTCFARFAHYLWKFFREKI